MKYILQITMVVFLLLSCNSNKQEMLKNSLQGAWGAEIEKINPSPPSYIFPLGFEFKNDSIDIFRGFSKYVKDTVNGKMKIDFRGTIVPYQLKNDSLFIKDPFLKDWKFMWTVKVINNDTLILKPEKSESIMMNRIKQKSIGALEFDRIVFSRSGCYGPCPIMDISVNKKGEVLFHGDMYVVPIGLYKSNTDRKLTEYVFYKYNLINFNELSERYSARHSDDEDLTTTFIKDNKIVKTVYDYGGDAPKELLWTYVPIQNLYNLIVLDTLKQKKLFNPKYYYFNSKKDSTTLWLEKSESFYLYTELMKARIVDEKFNPEYHATFSYWDEEAINNDNRIIKMESDGRFFKFYFKNKEPLIYDLGYNFITRNFTKNDFTKEK